MFNNKDYANERLMRLIKFDDSSNFKIKININENEDEQQDFQITKQSSVTINTTVNKARVISKNIDDLYQANNSIDHYEININDLHEKNKTRKICDSFQLLLNSIGNEVTVSDDIQYVFSLILSYLGEDTNNIHNEKRIQNIIEIISYFKSHNKQIKVSASGSKEPNYAIKNLFRYNPFNINDFYYYFNNYRTKEEKEGWIEFDFGVDKINLKSYCIRSYNLYYPRSWKITGSNDKENWDLLDKQIDNTQLNGPFKQFQFDCKYNCRYYRYIRYIQMSQWSNRDYIIYVSNIEFIGEVETNGMNTSDGIMSIENEKENANESLEIGFNDLFDSQ